MLVGKNGVSDTLNIKAPKGNFEPRIGFAATVRPGLVIRGGSGISLYPNVVAALAFMKNQPFTVVYSPNIANGVASFRFSDALPTPTFLPACLTLTCGPQFPYTISSSIDLDVRYAQLYQYNLVVEKQLGAFVVSAGYIGMLGRHLQRVVPNIDAALPPLGPGGCGLSSNLSALNACQPYNSILPNITQIQQLRTDGNSNFNAFQLIAQRRYSAGLTLSGNYTFGKAMSDVGGGFGQCATCMTVLNNFRRDWGPSDFMQRHRVAVTANYELPFGKSLKGVSAVLAKGWQVNGVYAYMSGLPQQVSLGAPRFGTGSPAGADRPDAGTCTNSSFQQSINQWFDISCYRAQPQGTTGNLGHNTLTGPPVFRFDASLFKDFTITETKRLQFRLEGFNVTNSPNFAAPTLAIGGFDANGIPTTAGNFGRITSTNGNYTPRDIQFALKFIF